jgi:hypothetical protein
LITTPDRTEFALPDLRGRYLALFNLAEALPPVLAPALATAILVREPSVPWPALAGVVEVVDPWRARSWSGHG